MLKHLFQNFVDNSNPTAIVTTQNISVEDKSSSLGISFVPTVTMPSTLNEIVSSSESSSVFASDIPKSFANNNAVFTLNPEVHSKGEKSSCLDSLSTQSLPASRCRGVGVDLPALTL